jgi:signal peptidase I
VYINDSATPLRDDFVRGAIQGNFGPYYVPEGHLFVLGDFRTNSVDSRRWHNTFVPEGDVLGQVIFRYFPGFRSLRNT